MKNEIKIHIPDELVASVNTDGSLVTIEERCPEFEDGDVIYIQNTYDKVISIFSNWGSDGIITYSDLFLKSNNFFHEKELLFESISICNVRLATSNEKAALFDRIKREGYQWNVNTKTLEEKYSPKRGDIIYTNNDSGSDGIISIFDKIKDRMIYTYCDLFLSSGDFYGDYKYSRFVSDAGEIRLASPEEIAHLFKKMKEDGLQWNSQMKQVEKCYSPKEGDIIFVETTEGNTVCIFKGIYENQFYNHCELHLRSLGFYKSGFLNYVVNIKNVRLATSEETLKLFKEIANNSLVWNPNTKTLDEIYNPIDGDFVFISEKGIYTNNYIAIYKSTHNDYKTYCCLNIKHDIFDIWGTFDKSRSIRKATEDEKNQLLKAAASENLYWNSSTKTLDEKFIPKNGDVIFVDCEGTRYNDCNIAIYNYSKTHALGTFLYCYCCVDNSSNVFYNNGDFNVERPIRLATEEEKQKLFGVIKENKLFWNTETKKLEPLVELIDANQGDYVFIKTKKDSYVAIFDKKITSRINLFGFRNIIKLDECYIHGNPFFNEGYILEMRLATISEVEEFNKQLISQNLMWNPYLKKFLQIPERGDLCIFYDDYYVDRPVIRLFREYYNDCFRDTYNAEWDYCIPYDEKVYKQMIDFK